MIFIIFLQGVFLFCSTPLGLFILNNLKVSFFLDPLINLSFFLDWNFIYSVNSTFPFWLVCTNFLVSSHFYSTISLFGTKCADKVRIDDQVENLFIQKSIFWGGLFLLFSSVFYMVSSSIVLDDTEGYHIVNI